MNKKALPFFGGAVTALLFAFAIGCQNPVQKVDDLEVKVNKSDRALVKEAQEENTTTRAALDAVPPSRATDVAKDSSTRAGALLDQANGPLTAEELNKRLTITKGLLSDVKAERDTATKNLAAERAATADIIKENVAIKGELATARETLKTWAVERDEVAKKWERLVFWIWVIGGSVAGIWLGSIILPILASVFSGGAAGPALGIASKLFGFVLAPAVQHTANRAMDGLQKVGGALNDIRQEAPEYAKTVTTTLDTNLDEYHQNVIRNAARAARLKQLHSEVK